MRTWSEAWLIGLLGCLALAGLDVLTTSAGLALGAYELNFFMADLVQVPLAHLAAKCLIALALAGLVLLVILSEGPEDRLTLKGNPALVLSLYSPFLVLYLVTVAWNAGQVLGQARILG